MGTARNLLIINLIAGFTCFLFRELFFYIHTYLNIFYEWDVSLLFCNIIYPNSE